MAKKAWSFRNCGFWWLIWFVGESVSAVKKKTGLSLEGNTVFQGAALLTLDAKGRMNIPSKHRDILQTKYNGELTLTCHPDGCLILFPRPVWEEKKTDIEKWPVPARAWQRIFIGNAEDVEMDSSGRILISPVLRTEANIDRDIKMMGLGNYFEIWDPILAARDKENAKSQGTPEALTNLNL